MLFGKAPSASKIVSNLFIAMAEDSPDEYDKDDRWWSEALETHLDSTVNLGNFADDLRDRIYLYLEHTIEDEIFNDLSHLNIQGEEDHGIYRCRVSGNA